MASRRRNEPHCDDKAVDERDMIDRHAHRSSQRVSHRSDRSQRTSQPQVFKNYGPITINNNGGNVFFAAGVEETLRSSPVPRTTSRVAQLKKRNERYTSDDSDSELSTGSSMDESQTSRSIRSIQPLSQPSTTISPRRIRTYSKDEGYGSTSTRSHSRKRGKTEARKADYNSDLSRRSSNASLAAESNRSQRRTNRPKSRLGSDNEDDEAPVGEAHLAEQGDENKREIDSDDELGFEELQVIDKNNKQINVEAVLDTGTKPDWVSAVFLKTLGLKEEPLDAKNNKEYTDFNGRGFKATGKVDLMIMNDNFPDAPCRRLTFLVTKLSKFEILLGRKTIFKEQLLQRPPKDLSGEGVFAGYQKGPKKEEKDHIARRKAEQAKQGAEGDKRRTEEKQKARSKEKQDGRAQSVNFAPEVKLTRAKEKVRRERSISPPRQSKSGSSRSKSSSLGTSRSQAKEKASSSSLDDVDDGGVRL